MIKKYKISVSLTILLFLLIIISITSIYASDSLLKESLQGIYMKQLVWYGLGIILVLILLKINNKLIYQYSFILYVLGILSLVLVLFFGKVINGATSWFITPFGSFQPSEFMKIILILINAKIIDNFKGKNNSIKNDLILILKLFVITLIPSILTFIQPDTGSTFIYLIIFVFMLFISGIRLRFFIIGGAIIISAVSFLFYSFLYNQQLFEKVFGINSFYRMERIMSWKDGTGYQYENAIASIGSGHLFGHGFASNDIYIPEAHTDYIFAVFASNFGFLATFIFLSILFLFNLKILDIAIKIKNYIDKYMIIGFFGIILYSQFQNIGMILGLLPITGITLPFISYGGSSLISYMLMIGMIFNASKNTH
ncbi:MAG: FtsW/RodA/SpoVE family cell cycle protein [Bacilli bacterium]